MPILTQDIKLLKSAVMADTSDGGGAMTGLVVVDGQSNNLFPDTSTLDRALGRVNMRKVFGVAHTDDTDTLLGSNAMITDAPDDPLVHCALLKTAGWADTRDAAREAIEKYLVKGPRAAQQLYDAHYAGSLQVRLISFLDVPFPGSGDALVLRTPAGIEQYIRLTRVVMTRQPIAVMEGDKVVVLIADIATCDIGQALTVDFFGPPAGRILVLGFATVFTTNLAGGVAFYGIKPLGVAGVPGDLTVTTSGGIFTPLVPAATIESAIIDQFPMTPISQLTFTSTTTVTLDASLVTLAPNRTLNFPTAIRPGSVSVVAAGLTFTDNSQGQLMQSGATVGTVDYKLGIVTFASGAPYNTTVNAAASYVPASLVLATNNSVSLKITSANQGLSFTNVFEPLPSPGSFSLSYMAQGRWYELTDNANGRLGGVDSSYGIGTVNYTSGSMAVTLGALPDVGSELLVNWGSQAAAVPVLPAALPARASVLIPLTFGATTADMTLSWENGATPYTAALGADGLLTGNATGSLVNGKLFFEPAIFPSGNIFLNYKKASIVASPTYSGSGGLYQITSALPVAPGTLSFKVALTSPSRDSSWLSLVFEESADVFDFDGVLYVLRNTYAAGSGAVRFAVGTVNYATGAIALASIVNLPYSYVRSFDVTGWGAANGKKGTVVQEGVHGAGFGGAVTLFKYAEGAATSAAPVVFTPVTWTATVSSGDLGTTSLSFSIGNQKYSVKDGSVVQNWSFGAEGGNTLVAGTVSGSGLIGINVANLPLNRVNALVFGNVAVNRDPGLISTGVFRILSAPVKTGVFQIQVGALVGTTNDSGVITGGGFSGTVDFQRGVVRWANTDFLDPALVSYNAVLLQYLPLDSTLLGLSTERLPLDGKVPIFRKGEFVAIHNTQTLALPNPLVQNTDYPLGRVRLSSVRVKDALGVVVPDTLYSAALNPGTITVPTAAVITPYTQPFTVEHRIEDLLLCTEADISGRLKFGRGLTHNFAASVSFVSSVLPFGDVFARAFNSFEQQTWTGVWAEDRIGPVITANYNQAQFPIGITNRGAITERWAMIFTNTTNFRIVGENVGDIGAGTTGAVCSPNNPATTAPYFTLPDGGWGAGWTAGNVLRFNTAACGSPFWAVRTVLQGPASLDSDAFTLAFRGDVDRP